jgi:20S proteasome subunit beta 1
MTRNLPHAACRLVVVAWLLSWTASAAASSEISMGTTIVALRTKQGVVVGADTRTSQGSMVSNRYADKLSLLYQNGPVSCVLCRSGSAADTQYLAEQARWEFQSRALRYNGMEPSLTPIAQWLRYVVRNGDYSASLLCVGYDPREGGRIFSIAPTGALLSEPVYAAAGSGSTFIMGLMDSRIREQAGEFLEEDEAIQFVSHLIHQAIARDAGSGGAARLVVLNGQGCRSLVVQYPSTISLANAKTNVPSYP